MSLKIFIIGDFDSKFQPHPATNEGLSHSAKKLGIEIESRWIPTPDIDIREIQTKADGVWIAPGSPYKNMENTLAAIRVARESKIPLIGTCGGFQHIILEYARNALGFQDAQHAEYDPYASKLFISKLDCSLAGRTLFITLKPGSRVAEIYGKTEVTESYYCNFGVNPKYVETLSSSDLKTVGSDPEGEIRVVELSDHPFFVGTLFVPQLASTPDNPHLLVSGFLKSAKGAPACR